MPSEAWPAGQVLGVAMMALGAIEALTVSCLDSLWLVLIGWFLITAATAERKAATAQAALAGALVAEVMIPDRN